MSLSAQAILRALGVGLVLATFLPAQPAFSTFLKANATLRQVVTDPKGYIYVYGETNPNANGSPQDVYLAKLDPATAKVLYQVKLGGTNNPTRVGGFTVDAAGNAYFAGYTAAPDFPTFPTVPNPASTNKDIAFAAKVDVNGKLIYSVLFSNGVSAYPQSILADSSGNVIISGISSFGFPATTGAYNNPWNSNLPFTTKLDPTGTKTIFSAVGVGGTSLAFDPAGNIYIAGTTAAPYNNDPNAPLYPTTPGAFQTTYNQILVCGATPFCMFAVPLGNQYVTKLSADGSALIFSTLITGSTGSYNAGMAVDAAGDVWLTGDTSSLDYPYSQPATAASLTGTFTTELDPSGSKVLLSVAQGVPPGSGNNLAFDSQGNLLEAGMFPIPAETTRPPNVLPTPAAPPTGNVPSACLPRQGIYALKVSSKDGSLLGTRILPGTGSIASAIDPQGNLYIVGSTGLPDIPLTPGFSYDTSVTQRAMSGSFLERTNFAVPASQLACVTDSVNKSAIGPVAPGQLITLYGKGIGPTQPAIGFALGASTLPTSLAGVKVTFNGQPAPVLYASDTQINVQAPFEIYQNPYTPNENAVMQLSYNGSVLATRLFAVTPTNPGLFLGDNSPCEVDYGQPAFALNQDGSINSCANPAAAGSQFTMFVNGVGTKSNGVTGMLVARPDPIVANAAVFAGSLSLELDTFTAQPGAISGIGQLTARVPATVTSPQAMAVNFTMDGLISDPLRGFIGGIPAAQEIPAVVFVKP